LVLFQLEKVKNNNKNKSQQIWARNCQNVTQLEQNFRPLIFSRFWLSNVSRDEQNDLR